MEVTWRAYAMRTYEDNVAGVDLATAWTAHLPICHTAAVPAALATLGCHPALSGEYLHEPSYRQWGEPAKIDHDPHAGPASAPSADPDHLAVYYRAPTEAAALEVAGALLAALAPTGAMPALCREVVVTHADDWDWDATITADPPQPPNRPAPPAAPAPAPVDLGNLEPGQTATVAVAGGGEGGYTLTITTTAAGIPLLMVDTEEGARLRIDAGDAMLALVEAGGDEITLPAHWRELHLDHEPAPR